MQLFLASFFYVSLKAAQQLNVVHHKMAWVVPISYAMAVCDFFIIGMVAEAYISAIGIGEQVALVIALGTGGGLGAILSMYVHKKIRGKINARSSEKADALHGPKG